MTTIEQVATLATFGSVWAVLAVGHNLADHVFGRIDHEPGQRGSRPLHHRTYRGQPAAAVHQIPMYGGHSMKRGHAEILSIHQLEHQRITNLVQSTDQSFHHLWLFVAALVIAAV